MSGLIKRQLFQVGCDAVQIDCSATDINWVIKEFKSEIDIGVGGGRRNISPLRECLKKKCGE